MRADSGIEGNGTGAVVTRRTFATAEVANVHLVGEEDLVGLRFTSARASRALVKAPEARANRPQRPSVLCEIRSQLRIL